MNPPARLMRKIRRQHYAGRVNLPDLTVGASVSSAEMSASDTAT